MQRMASFGFDFLKRYHKDGNEFFNHIVRVTGDGTWGLIRECWNQRVVKAVDAHIFTKQADNV
jgi:hypothetical protein